MMEHLEEEIGGQLGVHTRIRCLAHILNLVVKAMLVPFTKATKKGDENENENDDDDDDELSNAEKEDENEVEQEREDFDDDEVQKAMEEVSKKYKMSSADAKVAKSSLMKVRDKTLHAFCID